MAFGPSARISKAIREKKDQRREDAARQQALTAEAGQQEKEQGWADATNELNATYAEGPSGAELVSPELAIGADTDELGGDALKTQLMAGQGYSAGSAFNPFVQTYGFAAEAEDAHRSAASASADNTMQSWEASMEALQDEYGAAQDDVADERGRRVDAFRDEVGGLEVDRDDQDAQTLVQQWIESEKTGTHENAFEEGWGGRRGANNGKKAQMIDDLLAQGYSYTDILSDPDLGMQKYIESNTDTSGIYGAGGYADGSHADSSQLYEEKQTEGTSIDRLHGSDGRGVR